ncbi:MAG: DUF2752 domain-containing protein [Verrucomicrobiota bacterium]
MHKDRALLVLLVVLGLVFAAYKLSQDGGAGWMPGCYFRKLTDLECPGCGMTRATYAILHGRFAEAFRLNPVGIILFPLAMIGLGLEVLGWVRGKAVCSRLSVGKWGSIIIAAILIIWGVVRNLI